MFLSSLAKSNDGIGPPFRVKVSLLRCTLAVLVATARATNPYRNTKASTFIIKHGKRPSR